MVGHLKGEGYQVGLVDQGGIPSRKGRGRV